MRRASSSTMRTWRRSKSGAARWLEQRQHAEHALPAVHDRARQDLVRDVRERTRPQQVVGGHRLPVQLRPADQVPVRTREHSEASRGGVPWPARQIAMFLSGISSAPTEQPRWSTQPCTSRSKSAVVSPPVGFVLRGAEQQLEVAVARDEAALQVADAVLRGELALEALQDRPQHRLHRPANVARLRRALRLDEPDACPDGPPAASRRTRRIAGLLARSGSDARRRGCRRPR